jgi:hypothetical protein
MKGTRKEKKEAKENRVAAEGGRGERKENSSRQQQ